jgi:exportin-7
MDALPHMGRLKYTQTADLLVNQLEQALNSYNGSQARTPLRALAEGHLALLVLVVSGIVGGRGSNSSSNTELHNEIDALLTARVMKILQLHDENLQPANLTQATKRLELALLSFLQEFRKVYVGDPSLGTTRMFEKLAEITGIPDSNTMLTLIMRKIVLNLRHWAGFSDVIDTVTQLFYEMVTGYASIRLVIKVIS